MPLVLFIALPKKDAMTNVLRQATELGVNHIVPVLSRYAVPDKVNAERMQALVVEAAEQCERLSLPHIAPVQPLQQAVAASVTPVLWCAEHIKGAFLPCTASKPNWAEGVAVLVGPEGGFSAEEKAFLAAQPHVYAVGLGNTVLRVDTAVVAALALAKQQLAHHQPTNETPAEQNT